jgi:hypothetical protein
VSVSLVLCTLLALASPVPAVPTTIDFADSIESHAIEAKVVVRGFVTAVTKDKVHDDAFYDVTIQITESIKGGVKQSLRFALRGSTNHNPYAWRKAKTDLVLFLVEGKDMADDHPAFARYPYTVRRANGGDDASAFVLGKDRAITPTYDVIDKPTDVLAAIRSAVKSGVTETASVDVPPNTPAMKLVAPGDMLELTVPVDARLEQQAIKWLASPRPRTRLDGVRTLSHFKSNANIERLTALLRDTAYEDHDEPGVRDYLVRRAAHEILQMWHVAHDIPVTKEAISRP